MANYLQSWGLAEIIPVIYRRSCFKVHSNAPLCQDSRIGRAFESLLLSFNVHVNSEHDTLERINSEQILYMESSSSSPKRRASSLVSTDGSSFEQCLNQATSFASTTSNQNNNNSGNNGLNTTNIEQPGKGNVKTPCVATLCIVLRKK